MPTPVVLEKDPAMSNPANYIVNEQVVLDSTTGNLFVPQYGCFFTENLLIRKVGYSGDLRPYLDFTAIHTQQDAVAESGREVCSVLRIDLDNWEGTYNVSYWAYGGEYSSNMTVLNALLEFIAGLGGQVNWGDIVGKPNQFNPAAHTHVVEDDIMRWNDMVEQMKELTTAINNGGIANVDAIFSFMTAQFTAMTQAIATAVSNHNAAPSAHNKSAVGLSQLQNLPVATQAMLNAGTPSYVTADMIKQAVARGWFGAYGSITPAELDNITTVTSVRNITSPTGPLPAGWYAIIQIPEVDQIMTATTARAQIAVGVVSPTQGICAVRNRTNGTAGIWQQWKRFDNGTLNKVPNYDMAVAGNVVAGTTVTDKFMNPLMTRQLVENMLGNISNFSVATAPDLAAGSNVANKYMVPAGTTVMINNRIASEAQSKDKNNNTQLLTPQGLDNYLAANVSATAGRIGTMNWGPFKNTTTLGYLITGGGRSFNVTSPIYAELYNFILANYTVVNGPYNAASRGLFFKNGNTMYLPNIDGMFIRQLGGNSAGLGVYQKDALQDHRHYVSLPPEDGDGGSGPRTARNYDGTNRFLTSYASADTGARTATETRPQNVAWYNVIWYR